MQEAGGMISASLSARNPGMQFYGIGPGSKTAGESTFTLPRKGSQAPPNIEGGARWTQLRGSTETRGEHVHVDEQHLRALAFGGRQLALRTRRCQEPRAALRQRRRVIDCRVDLARRPIPLGTPLFWRVSSYSSCCT